jgi:hypothetical protein
VRWRYAVSADPSAAVEVKLRRWRGEGRGHFAAALERENWRRKLRSTKGIECNL